MKKKLLNNKGSTMLMLVMAVAVISILGTSILAVTLMNFRIKLANTQMKEAFYLSESGLDKAYTKAYDFIVDAVTEANEEAMDFVNSFDDERMYELIEDGDFTYLLPKYEGEVAYSFDQNAIQAQAKTTFEEAYKDYILADIADVLTGVSDAELELRVTNEESLSFSGRTMTVKIESEYTSEDDFIKTTAVDMLIEVPKFNEAYTVKTEIVDVNPFWLKVLAAENLDINSSSEFDGRVFVSGNLNINTAAVTTEFGNDLAVKGGTYPSEENGIRVIGSNSLTYVKDVYTRNILMNGYGSRLRAEAAGTNIYVRDDLEFNNQQQKVYINGNYYGFSDGSNDPGTDVSSGININEASGVELTIADSLYLQGTSYVDVYNSSGKKYQTGESLSVKGNYRAYLQPLLSYFNDVKPVEFRDYEHLRLADKYTDGGIFNPWDKADYINYYNNEFDDLTIPSGIKIGSSLSLGSAMDEGVLTNANYNNLIPAQKAHFTNAETEYNKHIERLGYDKDADNNNITGSLTFSNQIDLDKTPEGINSSDHSNFIHINESGITLNEENYKGLIITNGNVNISSNVKSFEGAIISGGTVTIEGSGSKEFTYNKSLVSKIIADKNLHNTVFEDGVSVERLSITTFETAGSGDKVDFTNLLKFRNWEIK